MRWKRRDLRAILRQAFPEVLYLLDDAILKPQSVHDLAATVVL